MDRYPDFENLRNSEHLSTDYLIRWRIGGSGIAILAIHGGEIEPGTSRIAGKAWAPFYYGGDTARMLALYKGKGRIVFSNASRFVPVWRVIDIVPDPTESGYP